MERNGTRPDQQVVYQVSGRIEDVSVHTADDGGYTYSGFMGHRVHVFPPEAGSSPEDNFVEMKVIASRLKRVD